MGLILAITQFILIAIICVKEVKMKSPAVFLWATLMVMFGIMHLLSILTGNSAYTNQTLNEASLFVICFCALYLTTRNLLSLSQPNRNVMLFDKELLGKKDKTVSSLILVFTVIAFMICYQMISFSGGLLGTSWSSMRDFTATLNYANSYQVYHIIYFSLSGLPLFLWIKKKHKQSIFCLALVMIVTIITRNRILVLPILVFVLALYIMNIKKLQIKHIIFAGVAGIVVIYIVYALRVFRHYGTIGVFLREFNFTEFFDKINLYIATDNGELGLRNDFYFFVENDNKFKGFGEWATYIRMLLVYIPTRFSFGLKPADFAQTMGAAIGMVVGGSTHPTLFGDCYANAGMLGIFLGIFWAIYCSIGDKIVMKCKNQALKALIYCLLAVTYVIIGRGSVYNSFFFVAYGLPALWFIVTILKKLPKINIKLK